MATTEKTILTVSTTVNAPVSKVWAIWTQPKHIVKWNTATPEWHTPTAENDLRVGGKFTSRMEAVDGSMGFDFQGEYTKIEANELIEYVMPDGRTVQIKFESANKTTTVTESFEAETSNPVEMQQTGWQNIMDSFKRYTESLSKMDKTHFEVEIKAPVNVVYSTMLGEKTYKEWTAEFNPTSEFKGSWDKGSKILFLGTDEKGNVGGMVATIKENIPNKFVSIQHLGMVQGDKEIVEGPEVEDWAGALENYSFSTVNGGTRLEIDVDTNYEWVSYFEETWPRALNKLKSIIEK